MNSNFLGGDGIIELTYNPKQTNDGKKTAFQRSIDFYNVLKSGQADASKASIDPQAKEEESDSPDESDNDEK